MKRIIQHIALIFALLLLGGIANEAWATDVTYHILTLPIPDPSVPGNYNYHMKPGITGWRLEAFKVVVKGQTQLELPAQYKSPLATEFTYYNAADVDKDASGTAQDLFANGPIKGVLYQIAGEATPGDTSDDATPVAERTTLSGKTAEYYVVYTYNASNTIAKLDGSVKYNIRTKYKDNKVWKDRGFIALNRGRNNRPAVLPTDNLNPEMLASEDFMVAPVTGTGVSPYWKDNNNKNKEADVASQFYFMFKFEGKDPYNIIIRTAYAKDYTYIEKNDGTNNFVYKWYKDASLFAVSSGNNCYIASDEHKRYKTAWVEGDPNPIDPAYDDRPGNYHGQTGVVWNSVALLHNSDNSGYVFMGTRTVDGNGAIPSSLYYLKQKDNCNNLNFASGNSTDNLSIEGIYPIEKVTFKVATPFYKTEATDDHIVSVSDWVSKYTVDNDPIETKYLPTALRRKYCEFNGKFYKDAACTMEITHFSEATKHLTEGYQVYIGYEVSASTPFKSILPSASYTTATWYELTDAGSTQEYGRKIKWNDGDPSGSFKNNGANGEYVKESEFAFVGDPYELKVLYRKGTEDADENRYVTLSTYDSWDIPNDETSGSFLLRKYNDTGHWSWNAGQPSADVTYQPNLEFNAGKDAQTITFNLSGLNGSKYYKITTGGTDASQIVSVNPRAGYVYKETATTATITVSLAENKSGEDKTMTLTIQEYSDNEGKTSYGTASVITITQGTSSSAFEGNEVTYSTSSSTRVKVLTLPTRTFTYKIVDKSGRIAAKASAEQTIFSTLSLASIPSIIVSPFLMGETVTFYDTYTDGTGRATLVGHEVTETPNVNQDIFVKYTTGGLEAKPIKLSEDQEFNVVLNGEYIYYDSSDGGSIKSKKSPTSSDKTSPAYLWKLRNCDPYAMLIDNMGARTAMSVSGNESVTVYNDAGTPSSETRQKGAWVKLAAVLGNDVALTFDVDRADAQQFIAKSGLQGGVYEVMVAAGDDGTNATDASKYYYNIGRTSETDIKIYDKEHYAHGNSVLMFQLEQTIDYKYHLIDKYNHDLLQLSSQSPDLVLPAEYQSPLVETYHYYDPRYIHIDGDTYTLTVDPTPVELTQMSDLEATISPTEPTASTAEAYTAAGTARQHDATSTEDIKEKAKKLTSDGNHYYKIGEDYYVVNVTKPFYKDIYVIYDINDRVKFNDKSSPYMLKFLQPHAGGYYLEDGNDKLTPAMHEAVYPYCNGDGSLNIYSDDTQKEQFNGGASTRPRWIWFFESEKKDPYHVMIHSNNTISFNGIAHPTYLQTFAVDFVQGATTPKHIVTCGTLPTIASEEITEYMVLGTDGQFRLRTTKTINDGTGDVRRDVTSFEQYWKTYNMAKLHILSISKSTDAFSNDESTWVVPTVDDPNTVADESTYRATLAARGWHSYAIYANATRWNGYNDKTDGHEKKCVEKLEHWFQTFEMGDGTFDIESASIPPVLVLLDLHGWEIMRRPLPNISTYPEGDTELAALRAYDSPMVDKYYFYSNATKATGCHKYSLRMQNGAERDQIKVNGERYRSTSLGDLPPASATGVKSNGALNDQYVIYTVKEEYAKSYTYTYNESTHEETETPSKFLMVQHGRYYKNETTDNKSYISKPVEQHTNPNGGNVYDMVLDPINHAGNPNIVDGSGRWIGNCLCYVRPNQNINKEMGIKYASEAGGTGEPWTELEYKKYYYNNGKAGFDPYNLQIQLLKKNDGTDDLRYLTSHMTSTRLNNGVLIGDYSGSGGTTNITLTDEYDYSGWNPNTDTESEGYDHTNLTISNQTFMAVSDANGNMQLMPRFDHTKRVDLDGNSPWETTLEDPVDHPKASATDNASMGSQTTFFVRSQIFEYKIINNNGSESLRYKRAGDFYPAITDHFKSPIAKDFTYYKGFAEAGAAETSSEEEWTAATGDFKRTAATAEIMNSQKNLLPTAGTYYYRIGKNSFTYKKVTVPEGKGLMDKQITGSFADAGLNGDDCNVYVRYNYDADVDRQGDRILEGKWFTVKLANKDLMSSETRIVTTEGETQGTNVSLFQGESKPATIDASVPLWQWKFLAAPADPSSEYYVAPDPYDVQIFNRYANYATTLAEPSPMSVGIKVPNANNGADHFALLSHTSGGYALAVAGSGEYTYNFVNGNGMTTSVGATTALETDFKQKAGIFDGVKSQLLVSDDVQHNYVYKVINNAGKFAVSDEQNNESAESHEFTPYLPDAAQTLLLNMEDYLYYGSAIKDDKGTVSESDDTYTVVPNTKLFTLYGLYDDVVWVRYGEYSMDNTEYKIPNKKAVVAGKVARDPGSHDVSLNINGELPYNIIWENDNMMESDNDLNIIDAGSHVLDGDQKYVWYFKGNDPYGLEIEHKKTGYYIDGSATLVSAESSAKQFMLLKKSGYDYGVFAQTGDKDKMLSFEDDDSNPSTAPIVSLKANPNKFIIFGLSVHDLIYRLIIAKTCPDTSNPKTGEFVDIPYREGDDDDYSASYEWTGSETKRIYGTTQRDLKSPKDDNPANPEGSKYQLGETISWGGSNHIYSHHAGTVGLGDDLVVPNVFYRPNCTFEYYIEGVYNSTGATSETGLDNRFKGLKVEKMMTTSDLIDKTVVVNVVYSFNQELATNSGLDFVRSTDQNLWYTIETQEAGVPQLARYTKTQGLTAIAGLETHYTNDYLFTPVGDVYGFKMYNRYTVKNGNESNDNDQSMVMTSTALTNNTSVNIAVPGSCTPEPESQTYTAGNEIYELITGDVDGYFHVHPVANNSGSMVYLKKDGSALKLSTTPQDWTFGLDMAMLQPYYLGAGNVGGLNATGKAAYKAEIDKGEGNYKITDIQAIVYNDDYIVHFTPGYYRLHSQPGIAGISPVRYASGYLHDIEKTAGTSSTPIPMHFYSQAGVTGTFDGDTNPLKSGFTETVATRGDIPVPATENDPSTIFYVTGANLTNKTLSNVTMGTQGLNVIGNKMGTGAATIYRLVDIGGGVVLLVNTESGNYLTFDQNETNKYDLHYKSSFRMDDVKWCMEPANTLGLKVATNNGGDGYYYSTLYVPYDVLLPADAGGKTYNAYICKKWHDEGVNPVPVPEKTIAETTYGEGKFVPAGTPVIIRTNDETGTVTLTIEGNTPSDPLPSSSNIFSGKYLEQLLEVDAAHDVYTMGLPFISDVSKDGDYNTTGDIVAPLPEQGTSGLGFYINATSNKEHNASKARWDKNNRYVIHNKIYYRATGPGARELDMESPEFVPVLFDFDGEEEEGSIEEGLTPRMQGDNHVYDLSGRCVATPEQVADGSWWQNLSHGIYILNGKKIRK